MTKKVNRLRIKLFFRKLFKKRCVDIIITHAPPSKIHDEEDICHKGFKIFAKLINTCKPRYFVHGHVHIYGPGNNYKTTVGNTEVINAYGYRIIEI